MIKKDKDDVKLIKSKKHKLKVCAFMLSFAFLAPIVMSGCGSAGKSAYDIAVENGFNGTQQEWLESLKGENGKDGQNGQDAVAPTVEINEEGFWVINGVVTNINAKGQDGQNGQDGQTPTIAIDKDGFWVINGHKTDVNAKGVGIEDKVMVSSPVDISTFSGKKITIVGDSITYGVGSETVKAQSPDYFSNRWTTVLGNNLGATIENKGISGSTMCTNVKGIKEESKRYSMLDVVKGYTGQTDYFIVFLGANDWTLSDNVPMGTLGSTDTDTVMGAANVYAQTLKEKFKGTNTKIYFFTPIISNTRHTNFDSNVLNKEGGYSLRDYCDAIIETCQMYNIPVLDLNKLSGIYYISPTNNNTDKAMADGVHPSKLGHKLIADAAETFMLANYNYINGSESSVVKLKFSATDTNIEYVVKGSNFELPIPTQPGKIFSCWVDEDGKFYSGGDAVEIRKSKTFEAVFINDEQKIVTVKNMYGGRSTHANIGVYKGKTIMEAAPEFKVSNKEGMVSTFYSDPECTKKFDINTTPITNNMTLYVYWELNPEFVSVTENNKILDFVIPQGKDQTYFDNVFKNLTHIVLPRKDTKGNLIKGVENQQDYFDKNNLASDRFIKTLTSIEEFVIPEGYTFLGNFFIITPPYMSVLNRKTYTVSLPSTLTTLSSSAFGNTPVAEFKIHQDNKYFTAVDGVVYSKDMTTIYHYPQAKAGEIFEVPLSVKHFSGHVFYGNKSLREITINIGADSTGIRGGFLDNSNIKILRIKGDAKKFILDRKTFEQTFTSGSNMVKDPTARIYVDNEDSRLYLYNIFKYNTASLTGGETPLTDSIAIVADKVEVEKV